MFEHYFFFLRYLKQIKNNCFEIDGYIIYFDVSMRASANIMSIISRKLKF